MDTVGTVVYGDMFVAHVPCSVFPFIRIGEKERWGQEVIRRGINVNEQGVVVEVGILGWFYQT
jgi:hypothetical protein